MCQHTPLGSPHSSLSTRLDEARAKGLVGCGHQAMDLLLALLGSASKQAQAHDDVAASVTIYTDGDEYRASFLLETAEDEPLLRAGQPATNPAQAIIHLLLELHDELLLRMASAEVQH